MNYNELEKIGKFFVDLNLEMERLDPFKWLKHIDNEDIPQTIEELQEDIDNLENSIKEYDGSLDRLALFITQTEQTIQYKKECIEYLQNTLESE